MDWIKCKKMRKETKKWPGKKPGPEPISSILFVVYVNSNIFAIT